VDHTTQSLQALSRQDKDMTLLKTRVLISFFMLSLALSCHFTSAIFANSTARATVRQFPDPPAKMSASDERRQVLWASLLKLWPPAKGDLKRKIKIYAESPDLTQICFRCEGDDPSITYIYVLGKNYIFPGATSKYMPLINCITFEQIPKPSATSFVLWSNGHRELTIPTS